MKQENNPIPESVQQSDEELKKLGAQDHLVLSDKAYDKVLEENRRRTKIAAMNALEASRVASDAELLANGARYAIDNEGNKVLRVTQKQFDTIKEKKKERELSPEQTEALLSTLRARFDKNKKLHKEIKWSDVEKALKARPESLWSLSQLENTGGEPDVFMEDKGSFIFGDCSKESPEGRRNVVFDKEAEEWLRKRSPDAKFNGNAADRVAEWGVDFMDEEQYRLLKKQISVDENTRSWLKTPADIREAGRFLYGRRFGVEVRVDGDVAYQYDSLGFRCALRVPKA